MNTKTSKFSRFQSDYGMSIVLVLLCVLFTLTTIGDHQPTGGQAAGSVASELRSASKVLILYGAGAPNADFADALGKRLVADGKTIVESVTGSPVEVRAAIAKHVEQKTPIDAIAVSSDMMSWPLMANLRQQFPSLGSVPIAFPRSSRWPTFLNRDNLLNIATQVVVIALLAVGMTLVIITGGIDLSVGSLVALSAVVCAYCIRAWGGTHAGAPALVAASAIGIALCAALGLLSGALITALKLPPFIATLGIMQIAAGVAKIIARGESIYDIPESFTVLGRGATFGGLQNSVVLMFVTYIIAHIAMSKTTFGRYVYATGGSLEAARLSGVRVNFIRLAVYTLSGAMAGLGGIMVTSQLKAAAPTYGLSYELKAIAAVVVGGTSLIGGSGKIFGTLIGALIIAVIENGMNLSGIESYTQQVVLGAVILVAVIFDTLRRGDIRR